MNLAVLNSTYQVTSFKFTRDMVEVTLLAVRNFFHFVMFLNLLI